jgi:hypothetical protein
VDAVGAQYDKTVDLPTALGLGITDAVNGNAALWFSQGKLSADLSLTHFNIVAGTAAGTSKVTKVNPKDVSFSLVTTQSTGTFNGSFTPDWAPVSKLKPTFRGVLLQKGANQGGYGFFISNRPSDLDPESGRAILVAP